MASKRKTGSARNPRAIFRLVANKAKATTEPVASVDDLKGLWDRQWSVYRPLVVKVVARKGSLLSFQIVVDPSGATSAKVHKVDLDDGANVWGDLPSTAQLVEPGTAKDLGYLLVNQNWLFENDDGDGARLLGGATGDPPKIPRIFSL
jgi:hypothetical protein